MASKKDNLEDLKVDELKALCKESGLKVSGTKAELVARLKEKDEGAAKEPKEAKNEEVAKEEVAVKDEEMKEEGAEVKEEAKEVKDESKEESKKVKEESNQEESNEDVKEETKEEAPKMQEETDASEDKRPRVTAADVCLNTADASLNVMPSSDGRLLMTLCDGGFQYLLGGVRCSAGAKAGRYFFETKIVENLNPSEGNGRSNTRTPQPRQLVRLGVCLAGASPLLDESNDKVFFDSDGYFCHGRRRSRSSQRFSRDQVVGLLINRDADSPNANTISLFCDGQRVSDPQPLPEEMAGKVVYPCITYKNVTLQVNFGPTAKKPLPFKCRMLKDAAAADVEISPKPQQGKHEVLFPVGLPDQGLFDWLDGFLEQNRQYVELSDRQVIDWGKTSMLHRPRSYSSGGSNDKPGMNFGIPLMDDWNVQRTLESIAPALQRDFVHMELRSNLLAAERKTALARFPASGFRRVAVVAMGEPPQEFKAKTQAALLAEKVETAKWEKEKAAREGRKRKCEGDEAWKAKDDKKEVDDKKEGDDKEGDKEEAEAEEEKPIELTEEEKKLWFVKHEMSDLTPAVLAKAYASFSLPIKEEGFDEIRYVWSSEQQSAAHMKAWMLDLKKTQRAEDLEPSEWFKEQYSAWQKALQGWRTVQNEARDAARNKKTAAHEKSEKKDGEDGEEKPDGEESEKKKQEAEVEEEPDTDKVEDVNNIGNGSPLFANFVYEDWALLALRFELHLLVHAFSKDLDDPDRPSFAENHLAFYFNKYYKKEWTLKYFNINDKFAELIELIKDCISVNADSGFLEAALPADAALDKFIRLTEEHRRDRQRCVDAGDETANLKFDRPPVNPPSVRQGGGGYQGNQGGGYRGNQGGGSAGPRQTGSYQRDSNQRGGPPQGGGRDSYRGSGGGSAGYGAPPARASDRGGSGGGYGGASSQGGGRDSYRGSSGGGGSGGYGAPPSRMPDRGGGGGYGGSSQGQKRPLPPPAPAGGYGRNDQRTVQPRHGGGPPGRSSYPPPPGGGYGGSAPQGRQPSGGGGYSSHGSTGGSGYGRR